MKEFSKEWDVEMAMEVLTNKNVSGEIWSEAVEWLLIYGPPEVKEVLSQASSVATTECFPELKAKGYTDDGKPCYDINEIATSLGITPEEAADRIHEKEKIHGLRQLFEEGETNKIQ